MVLYLEQTDLPLANTSRLIIINSTEEKAFWFLFCFAIHSNIHIYYSIVLLNL